MNTSLSTQRQRFFEEKKAVYCGTVVGEEHFHDYVRLALHLDRAVVNSKILQCHIPVQYYTWQQETYLGKYLTVEGKVVNSGCGYRVPILIGTLKKNSEYHRTWGQVLYTLREYIHCTLCAFLPADKAQIAVGLVLGGSGQLDPALKTVFSRAGVLHILAVSGLHVGFVCACVGALLLFIPVPARVKFMIIMAVVVLYAGITGFRPSVCRATVMALLFGLAVIMQRHVGGVHITNVAAITFLIADPLLLFNTSAQLSFAAVYGIVIMYPHIEHVLLDRVSSKLLKFILALMAVSFSAQLFVSPLLVYYFKGMPTLAVFSNLVVVPVTAVVVFLLFGILMTALWSGMCAGIIAWLAAALLSVLTTIAAVFASIPWSVVLINISPVFLVSGYMFFSARLHRVAVYWLLILLIIYSVSLLPPCCVVRSLPHRTLITVPNGETIYIATEGPRSQNLQFLASQDIDTLDFVIAQEDYYPIRREFLPLPRQLQHIHYAFGDLHVSIADSVTVCHGSVQVLLHENRVPDSYKVWYAVTNGSQVYRFTAPQYGSLLDQVVVDVKLTCARLLLLFQR